jgi:hypothetical protein
LLTGRDIQPIQTTMCRPTLETQTVRQWPWLSPKLRLALAHITKIDSRVNSELFVKLRALEGMAHSGNKGVNVLGGGVP